MKFRQRLFWALAILSLVWIAMGFTATEEAVNEVLQTPVPTLEGMSQETADSLQEAGTAIFAGASMTVFLCTGLIGFFIFALLAWRNGVGLRNRRQHEEMVAAVSGEKVKND